MTLLISVVIPAYNSEKFLGECLESVLRQSYPDFEIIVVNDGSTDSTDEILKEYAERDSRVRFVTQSNGGQATARNTGTARARGEWIAFLDADDTWHPGKLAAQIELIQKSEIDLVYTGIVMVNEKGQTLGQYAGRPLPANPRWAGLVAGSNPICTSSTLVRREALSKVGGFHKGLEPTEDWELWVRLLAANFRPGFVAEKLVNYTIHSSNASAQPDRIIKSTMLTLDHLFEQGELRALGIPQVAVERWRNIAYSKANWRAASYSNEAGHKAACLEYFQKACETSPALLKERRLFEPFVSRARYARLPDITKVSSELAAAQAVALKIYPQHARQIKARARLALAKASFDRRRWPKVFIELTKSALTDPALLLTKSLW